MTMRNDLLNAGPSSKSHPVNQTQVTRPLSFEMSVSDSTAASPTIKNEFMNSFEQTGAAGDANILDTLHITNHQRSLDGDDSSNIDDNMWNIHLNYEPVE